MTECNVCLIGILEGEEREGSRIILEEKMAENFEN